MEKFSFFGSKVLAVAKLFALIWMLLRSDLIKTHYFSIILVMFSGVGIGALFKLMHWPFAKELLLISLLGIVVTYAVRFVRKAKKGLLDWLKLVWLFVTYVGSALVFLHRLHANEELAAAEIAFWAMFAVFVYEQLRPVLLRRSD